MVCLQDFWWVSSRFLGPSPGPPLPRTAPPPDRSNFALFFFSLPPEISFFSLEGLLRSGQIRSNKIGQIRPNKVGQMRPVEFGQMCYWPNSVWPNAVATPPTHPHFCQRRPPLRLTFFLGGGSEGSKHSPTFTRLGKPFGPSRLGLSRLGPK